MSACTHSESRAGPGSAAPLSTTAAASRPVSPPTTGVVPRQSTRPAAVDGSATIAFAGDVHFAGRVGERLAADPATVFGEAAPLLRAADLTVVNLETAIAVGGQPANKTFTFQAPPNAFDALREAGIDVASMANNHGADYGADGVAQSLAAIRQKKFAVIGFGANAGAAYAPLVRSLNGVRVALIAASQVPDETLANFTAGDTSAGIANAYSPKLLDSVRAARAEADVVIVFLHWGTEYQACPNPDQQALADQLSAAGADAVIGTHAHLLQGMGWRPDGTYVAYGLGNYLWWRSFGSAWDDNGLLTLTIRNRAISEARFAPSRLDDRGVPVPATGETRRRILADVESLRGCAHLAAHR